MKNYFNNKDFSGMQREYEKIHTKIKEIVDSTKSEVWLILHLYNDFRKGEM